MFPFPLDCMGLSKTPTYPLPRACFSNSFNSVCAVRKKPHYILTLVQNRSQALPRNICRWVACRCLYQLPAGQDAAYPRAAGRALQVALSAREQSPLTCSVGAARASWEQCVCWRWKDWGTVCCMWYTYPGNPTQMVLFDLRKIVVASLMATYSCFRRQLFPCQAGRCHCLTVD